MDEVVTHTGNNTDDRGTKNGKKRTEDMEPREEKERKRVKVDEGPYDEPTKVKINLKKVPKQKTQNGRARSKVARAFIEPKWNVVQPIKTPLPPEVTQSQEQPVTGLKPRIWTSSREELVVLLPELAGPKCLNGVSWLMYETPMILLDESTTCFDISLQEDSVALDLLTTREFTCTLPPRPERMPDPQFHQNSWPLPNNDCAQLPVPFPEHLIVNDIPDGDCSNLSTSVTSSSKQFAETSWSKQFAAPSLPPYTQDKAPVESNSKFGPNTKVFGRISSDLFTRRGQRTGAAGSRKETQSPLIDFSPPLVPSYAVHGPVFSESLQNAQSIGSTATKYRREASPSSIRQWDSTTKIREQNYSALQTGQVMSHQPQARVETANNPSLTFCTSSRSGKCPSSIGSLGGPLSHRHLSYETKCSVSTDTTYTSPEVMDNISFQAVHTSSLHPHIAVTNNQVGPDVNKRHSSDPTKPTIGLQATETVEFTNRMSDKVQVDQIRDVDQDTFMPSTLPEEIQAVIDSYLSGRPVLLIISNKRFFDNWSLCLPEEFGFSMLGYFRILGVQESRVDLDDPAHPLNDHSGLMTGRVKWRFRLQWSPGGEEWILPDHDKNLLEYPWWKPPPLPSTPPLEAQIPSLNTQSPAAPGVSQEIPTVEPLTPPLDASTSECPSTGKKDLIAPFEPESTFDTTPRYREARLSNVNYKFRHVHFRKLYHSLVPLPLLAPYGRTVLDSSFPRGWLCESCGKMNFQAALRHRMCSSSFCKGLKQEIAPYAIELMFMRDPQDNLSMVLPYNEPLLINLVDTWEDGTRTLPYYIHDDKNIFIKHIFTRNLPLLQLEATRLLHFIQLEVELIRPISENSPYFQYSAHAPKDDPSPTTSEWPNVPLSIHHAKDWTQHQAIWFGELKEEQLSINHLCLLAWVTSGTKRGPAVIRAKEKCVVFHAFGCNITVMVTPVSSRTKITAPANVIGIDIDSSNLITMDDLPPDEPDADAGWIAGLDEDDDADEHPLQEERAFATSSKKMSNLNRPFLFTLVHGDVLVFFGDDFEYSLKRVGTSFLLITSHQDEP